MSDEKSNKPTTTRVFIGDSLSAKSLEGKLTRPGQYIEKGQSFAALAPKLTAPEPAPQPTVQPTASANSKK
ncbi:hypothetical protein [Phyllobacterium sp. YR531]|uniref:hypothetical protein n=1 Tax=Phyllobacterium sp. YR531 TaxID=1144343 RepID=UPI00026F5B51|nr:hypothetical protein [Phyllobacterium sp. YR531]EJN04469.1 hypothetical protein PMI41_02110 [Phyllobacterium sp. YR531]